MIVVVGEALVDLAVAPDGATAAHPGGGPFNVARALGRLGTPVTFIGRVSRDAFGRRLRDTLANDGVSLAGVVDTDAPTTLAVAELDAAGAARYRFYLDGTSAPGLTPDEALARLPADVAALHVGTLALVVPPAADAVHAVAARLAGRALVLVDPNCRPGIAGIRERFEAILPLADVVKASADDLAVVGPPERLLEAGPRVVLVTRGSAPVLIVSGDAVTEVPTPPARVVDTIGAGDAFGGAFLAHWHAAGLGRDALADAAAVAAATRFATTVASRTCERAGADPPWADELTPEPGAGLTGREQHLAAQIEPATTEVDDDQD